jgi:hypothetical protein
MLLQIIGVALIITYIPILIELAFFLAILVFAIFIYKKNHYKYGLFLLLSSIFMIAYIVIYISINYPYLGYTLSSDFGMSTSFVNFILMCFGFLFWILNTTSVVFFFISVYFIYQTHKGNRD